MEEKKLLKELIQKLNYLFNKKEKQKLMLIFFMVVVAAFFETLGIGLIVPFVQIVMEPSMIFENSIMVYLYDLFSFQSTNSFLIFSAVMMFLIFVFKNLYLLLCLFVQNKVILTQQARLSSRLYGTYLNKPYTFHLQRNTAELLRNIKEEVRRLFQEVIMSTFQLLTELLVIACIFVLMLIVAPIATLIASLLLGGSVFVFFSIFRKKTIKLGKKQQEVSGKMFQWINQGLGASKEIKVMGNERFFLNAFTKQSNVDADVTRFRLMLEQSPRLFLETIIVSVVIITMLIIIFQGNGNTQVVTTMALFVMAAFRIMPSLNRIMTMFTRIRFNKPALTIVYEDLFASNDEEMHDIHLIDRVNTESLNHENRAFTESITLKNVSYRYPNQTGYTIKNISLTIPIGQSIAFIGESGAGKTTLVDLILGVIKPEKGEVLIDGMSSEKLKTLWQQKIGYIPQSIFLSDDSIRCNVAFGVESSQIDDKKVWRALEQAKLIEFVEKLPGKLEEFVGERGIRLSGGQRQRLGIARALYHNPEILFMDEATSALDNETEQEIMEAIDGLKGEKTLIIIAHRLTTIENCDVVFKIDKGKLVEVDYKSRNTVVI